MVYVSHDLAVVAKMADRIVVMYAGRVVEDAPAASVIQHPRHPYTRALVAAIPDFRHPRALRGIPGVSVGVGEWPDGCSFAPRCSFAEPRCEDGVPVLEEPSPGHAVRCRRCNEITPTSVLTIDARARAREAVVPPLLDVSGLEARYGTGRGAVPVVRDVVLRDRARQLRRARRRVRQRQDDDRTLHRRAARAVCGRDLVRREAARRRRPLAPARRAPAHPDRLPEPVRVAQPAPPRRRLDRASAARAARALPPRRGRRGGRAARARAAAEARGEAVPDGAVRRRAPAGRDRPRAGAEARPADLRRGHVRARRVGAGRRARAACRSCSASCS